MPIHKPTRILIICAAFLLCLVLCRCDRAATNTTGQQAPSNDSSDSKGFSIPFELSRNKVILPVRISDSRELRIILDTGMPFEGLLVYNVDLRDSLDLRDAIDVQVPGAGKGPPATAVMADSVSFSVGEVDFTNQKVIILQNDVMKGFPTDGVTGYSLLGNYVVEIDYDGMVVRLHENSDPIVDSSWGWIPLTFRNNRKIPWLEAEISIRGEDRIPVSLYIDLASSDALELLMREGMKFGLPEGLEDCYLGRGLSGDIYGKKGRIASLIIGSFELENIVTAFAPAHVRSKQEGADGIVGNDALRRFNVIFDYQRLRLYMKPNSYFSEPFHP